jgi:hypothetical protein
MKITFSYKNCRDPFTRFNIIMMVMYFPIYIVMQITNVTFQQIIELYTF